jgi:hypothetical protein
MTSGTCVVFFFPFSSSRRATNWHREDVGPCMIDGTVRKMDEEVGGDGNKASV